MSELSLSEAEMLLARARAMRDTAIEMEHKRTRLPGDEQIIKDCEESLIGFIRHAWHILEPNTEFVDGWAIQAICQHLEAVTHEEINRLLINVIPGILKSMSTRVFWPAWEWGPMGMPWLRYVTASYSTSLSERDALKLKRLVESEWYQRLWPHVKIAHDQSAKTNFHTTRYGGYLTTSVSGVGTGERGDRFLCFPYYEIVQTESGPIPIGKIVDERMNVRVWSTDVKTGKTSLKPIEGWHKNPGSQIVEVELSDGSAIHCTPDHRIWTRRGWVEAQDLCSSDRLPSFPISYRPDKPRTDGKHLGQDSLWKRGIINLKNLFLRQFSPWSSGPGHFVRFKPVAFRGIGPCFAATNVLHSAGANAISFGNNSGRFRAFGDFYSFLRSKFCPGPISPHRESPVPLSIGNVLGARAIGKVIKPVVQGITIKVPDLMPLRRWANKGKKNNLVNIDMRLALFADHVKAQISLFIIAGLKYLPVDLVGSAFSGGHSGFTSDAPHVTDAIHPLPSGDRYPVFIRKIGHVENSYCLTVKDNHTFMVGDRQPLLVSNCDDPNSVKEAESDAVRNSTNHWWKEVVPTRVNSVESAIVAIQQRTHGGDVSGTILDDNEDDEYTHLCLPMRFDPAERCETSIGFVDPRTEEGELIFPERFPEWWVAQREKKMGPYAVASQFQQKPVLRGGGIIQREAWRIWKEKEYPVMEFVLGSLDTAYTEKEENDYSALTIWGVWRDPLTGQPQVMLMYAWHDRKEIHELVQQVEVICRKMSVHKLLIENKAAGHSVKQELRRLFNNFIPAVLVNVGGTSKKSTPLNLTGDKAARAYAVQHLFHEGLIWRPDRPWAEAVANEMAEIPKGDNDDLADTGTMALNHLRLSGFMLLPREGSGLAQPTGKELLESAEPVYDV